MPHIYILEINMHMYEYAEDMARWITKTQGYPKPIELRKIGEVLYVIYKYIPPNTSPSQFHRIIKNRGIVEVWGT